MGSSSDGAGSGYGDYKIDNCFYDIEIHNNLPQEKSFFRTNISVCDHCL